MKMHHRRVIWNKKHSESSRDLRISNILTSSVLDSPGHQATVVTLLP